MAKLRKAKSTEDAAETNSLTIPLPAKGVGSASWWAKELDKSSRKVKRLIPIWRKNLETYKAEHARRVQAERRDDVVDVNLDFYQTERKKAQLFFQEPDLQLTALQDAVRPSAPVAQAVLNKWLGVDKINAARVMEEVCFDMLCPAGLGPVKIGYDFAKITKQVPRMEPAIDPLTGQVVTDPATGQPQQREAVDPDTGQPLFDEVDETVWDDYYMRRISPADLRLPLGFTSTNYDEAPWIGFRFLATPLDIEQEHGLASGSVVPDASIETTLVSSLDREAYDEACWGYEIWYRAYLFDPEVKNPERIRRIVMTSERKNKRSGVVVHENSPFQLFDGEKFQGGMLGYPVHVFTLRPVGDDAYPSSDCTVSRAVADEMGEGRAQMQKQRRRNIALRAYNELKVRKETIQKIERGDVQALIGFKGPISDTDFRALDMAHFPSDNFRFDDISQRTADRLWALGPNQGGVSEDNVRSATEVAEMGRGSETLIAKQRSRVLGDYVICAQKLFALLQIFADKDDIITFVGQDDAVKYELWNKAKIQGQYAFKARPDSTVRLNAAEDRELFLKVWNLFANHPLCNVPYLMEMGAAKFNLDPSKIVMKPKDPAPPQPEPPKVSISVSPADLVGMAPGSPEHSITLQLLASGVRQPPPAPPGAPGAAPTPQEGGPDVTAAQGVPPVSKRQEQISGKPDGRPPQTVQ